MTTKTTIAKLQAVAKQLKKAAKWNGSLVGVDAKTDDYVFELLCLYDIALAKGLLKATIVARADPDKPTSKIARWPKKPGEMKNFSYFKLEDPKLNNLVFRLCPGINVTDKHGKNRAQDINLLKAGTSELPKHTELLGCWDAKYVSDPLKRMSDVAVADFIYTFRSLGSPTTSDLWKSTVTIARYKKSGLITNGENSTEPDSALVDEGIFETKKFPDAAATRP